MTQYLGIRAFGVRYAVWAGVLLGIALVPHCSWAASVQFSTDYPTPAVGDTVMVNVMMDTGEKNPNTVSGTLDIKTGDKTIEITDFSVAGSVLTNWLQTPSLESNDKVSFMAGVPGGFHGSSERLFTIILTAREEGTVVFSSDSLVAYDNDGKATPIPVSGTSLTMIIGPQKGSTTKDQWHDVVAKDNAGPKDLTVAIGQDEDTFDGKKFLSISAMDAESGLDHFEVAEGNWPAVRTGQTYVLRDQNESVPITVIAYDKAGNASTIMLNPDMRKWGIGLWLAIVGGGVLVGVLVWRGARWWKHRKINQT